MSRLRVLIVPDKFKGTLRADQAAEAIAAGWRSARPEDQLELLPMSDGGDGFGEIIGRLLGAKRQSSRTVNAAHEPIETAWWWSEQSRTAVAESASVIGLAMLPPGRSHPFELDTLGLGQLLLHISRTYSGCGLIIGVGGSATNDGGLGMARGLGYRFIDHHHYPIDRWISLESLVHIKSPEEPPSFSEVIIATDVQNRLLGPEGASRIYGPQKGLRPEDFPAAERCLARLAEVVRSDLGVDRAEEPGTGAAGGLGYGLRIFLNGRFEPGFDIFARLARLDEKIAAADLIITGEGAIDTQTAMGKGTGAIAKLARAHQRRCIGLAGTLAEKENPAFDLALGIAPELTDAEKSKRDPRPWLEKLAALAAARIPALVAIGFVLFLTACQNRPATRNRSDATDSPEARAVAYLAREVPVWSRENGCYSCHNNGDGARALFFARQNGYAVPDEALSETIAWLRAPNRWSDTKIRNGRNRSASEIAVADDPSISDQRLTDIQFAVALLAAYEAGLIRESRLLDEAALRLLPHQSADGCFDVEPHNPIGTPVTYGTTLATYLAWRVLSTSTHRSVAAGRDKAGRWLNSRTGSKNVPEAAAMTLYQAHSGRNSFDLVDFLCRAAGSTSRWGPYAQSPPEIFDTSMAMLALAGFHHKLERHTLELLRGAREYLASEQNADGSWPPTTRPSGGESYAQQMSTTAWAAMALIATADHFTSKPRSATSRVIRFWTSENKSTSKGLPTLFPARSSMVVCTRRR